MQTVILLFFTTLYPVIKNYVIQDVMTYRHMHVELKMLELK